MPNRRVFPASKRLTEADARRALAVGLNRLCSARGPQRVGLEAGCDEKTIRSARDEQSSMKLHTALNLLSLDPTALDELLAEYGFRLTCLRSDAANDFAVLTGAAEFTSSMAKGLEDGRLDHLEKPERVARARDLIAQLEAFVRAA